VYAAGKNGVRRAEPSDRGKVEIALTVGASIPPDFCITAADRAPGFPVHAVLSRNGLGVASIRLCVAQDFCKQVRLRFDCRPIQHRGPIDAANFSFTARARISLKNAKACCVVNLSCSLRERLRRDPDRLPPGGPNDTCRDSALFNVVRHRESRDAGPGYRNM